MPHSFFTVEIRDFIEKLCNVLCQKNQNFSGRSVTHEVEVNVFLGHVECVQMKNVHAIQLYY